MATRGEYTYVADIRTEYLDIENNDDDALLLRFIRSVSREIDVASQGWFFYPLMETRYFDARRNINGRMLNLDMPLLAVTTLTNGDAVAVSADEYVTEPRNVRETPKWGIRLLGSSGLYWSYDQDPENAISLAGTWGYHPDYANAWESVGTIATSGGINSSVTTFAATTGHSLKAGMLLKCGTELMYLGTLDGDTVTNLLRGVNGSTAASHDAAAELLAWTVSEELAQLARVAAVMRYKERQHPNTDTFTLANGETIVIPKDIGNWIEKEVERLGLQRVGAG